MDNDFKTLQLKTIEENTQQMENELGKLKGDLEECLLDDNPNSSTVLDILESKVKMVQVLLPVLRLLLREQFKDKHWNRILEKLKNGNALINQNHFTLKNLKHGGINSQLNEVERVYLEAVSETQMEKEIESIQSEWERTEVRFKAYGEDRTRQVLTGIEFLLLLVDRHLEKIQKMRKFEQIEEIKVTIRNWESKLDIKQKIMRSCEEFQEKWKGLFKMFNSVIGQKQLQNENDLFEKLDKEFLDFTTKAGKKTNILDVFTDQGLEEKFIRLNYEADALIQSLNPFIKGLKDDVKRLTFLTDTEFMTLFGEVVFHVIYVVNC
jgi:dynein heavy chain